VVERSRPAAASVVAPPAPTETHVNGSVRASDERAAAPSPLGWIEVASSEPVTISEGDQLLATDAHHRVRVAAGMHHLRIVNASAGIDVRRSVEVAKGKVAVLPVDVRRGLLAINATPWAEVWLDGQQVGQTPLGNLPTTAGVHIVMFRHPSLGEQRRTVVVPATGTARLSVDLTRP
jgi:hypothetical protein